MKQHLLTHGIILIHLTKILLLKPASVQLLLIRILPILIMSTAFWKAGTNKMLKNSLTLKSWIKMGSQPEEKTTTGRTPVTNQFNHYQGADDQNIVSEFENIFLQETNQ